MAKRKSKKRKINKRRVILFFIIFTFLTILIYKLFTNNITNIYIKGNSLFNDQEIIDIARLKNYPTSIKNTSISIKKRLEKNKFILDAKVYKKKLLTNVYIKIKENYPLFYYNYENKTILYDGTKVDDNFSIPVVINQIPDTIYDKFIKKMKQVDIEVLNRMSEIEYKPNEVDEERFLIFMNDGNYVYLTLYKFLNINKYLDMIKLFENEKGILYLDSGEYFDVFDK